MSKVTTQQFLDLLGIGVGKPFMLDGVKYKVIYRNPYWIAINLETGFEQMRSIEMLLNCEITPLPKYTLTDDEKAIVRNIPLCFDKIGLSLLGNLELINSTADETVYLPLRKVFEFIEENDEVSIDELRKCL